MKLPEYEIATKQKVFDKNDADELCKEQDDFMEERLGITLHDEVECHFFESVFSWDNTEIISIRDAIEALAIKDGVDLVRFSNGNYGFVAYYNGYKNGFEILKG